MNMLELRGQLMAVLALPLKFQFFLEQRSFKLALLLPFLRI